MDRKIASMDRVSNQEEAEQFLQALGLRVDENVVRKVIDTLQGKSGRSKYSLWAHGTSRGGGDRNPICGKGTVYKIENLFKEGKLEPYLSYLDAVELGSGEVERQGSTHETEHVAFILSDEISPRLSSYLEETDSPDAAVRAPEAQAHEKAPLVAQLMPFEFSVMKHQLRVDLEAAAHNHLQALEAQVQGARIGRDRGGCLFTPRRRSQCSVVAADVVSELCSSNPEISLLNQEFRVSLEKLELPRARDLIEEIGGRLTQVLDLSAAI